MLSLSRRRKLDLDRIRGSSRQPKPLLNTLIGHQAQDADSRGTRELTREICECTGNAAGYGNDTGFRDGITELGLLYVVGIQSSVSVWKPGQAPLPKRKWKGIGRPTKLVRRDDKHAPVAVRELAMSLPASAWKTVRWRQGTRQPLRSRFAAVRVRAAHRDYWSSEPRPEEWLLIEWPKQEAEPTKYWLSTLPASTNLS